MADAIARNVQPDPIDESFSPFYHDDNVSAESRLAMSGSGFSK